jgi:broad specificity phosphatase PhoE
MASIYLIRHGQASFGAQDYDKLSELGRRQATLTGQYLRDTGAGFDAAYCGTLRRQRDTAQLVLAAQPDAVPLHEDARLDEVRNDEHVEHLLPIVAEQRPDIRALVEGGFASSKHYQKIIDAVFNYWVSPECRVPGIQSWDDYAGGVRSMLRDIVAEQGSGKSTAVFASGGTIAVFVAAVLGLPGEATYQFYEPVFNCSVTQLFYSRERVSLSYFNDCSFLRLLSAQTGEQLVTYR